MLAITLREESMPMNALINLMILFMCQKFPSYIIQLVALLNSLLVIATIIKEEVINTLFIFLVMI
jgi:hypothetical protein